MAVMRLAEKTKKAQHEDPEHLLMDCLAMVQKKGVTSVIVLMEWPSQNGKSGFARSAAGVDFDQTVSMLSRALHFEVMRWPFSEGEANGNND